MVDNTFFSDFTIADKFGIAAIKDTYRRAFKGGHTDYKMLTALSIALNHKVWEQTDAYAISHLKGDALRYYYKETD